MLGYRECSCQSIIILVNVSSTSQPAKLTFTSPCYQIYVCVIKIGFVYYYMVRLTEMVTQKWSCVMFTFQVLLLLLLLRYWTLCRRLFIRCSLSPTLFIHFWTSLADASEYLHLSAPTGALLVVSCIITVGSFSEGHLYCSSTANRSCSAAAHTQRWLAVTTRRDWGTSNRGLSRDRHSRIPPSAV